MFALTALSAMEDFAAYEQLRDLLGVPSAETRYGAFRALWKMNGNDSLVKGEQIGDQFSYHVLDTQGPPMIHVTRNRRAEVVLFGQNQRLLTPLALSAGTRIMVTSTGAQEIAVSKFTANEADQKRVVSTRVDDVIRAIVGTWRNLSGRRADAPGGRKRPMPSKVVLKSRPCPRPAEPTNALPRATARKSPTSRAALASRFKKSAIDSDSNTHKKGGSSDSTEKAAKK